jgi:predicted acylesterase/phospholipase RssA
MAFHIALNMAGAVSAGAYTAGVLDYLIEALDAWEAEKDRQRAQFGDDTSLWTIPAHEVVLEVMSGASAGGMCSAIGSVALREQFDHIHTTNPGADVPRNRLYRSWVDTIDILPLLGTDDLPGGKGPVRSLLDSSPIEAIAKVALQPDPARAQKRAWVADQLGVVLTLTNLRGVPYSVDESDRGSFEERMAYHADRIEFRVADSGAVDSNTAYALNYSDSGNANWQTLATAAMATGAFPVMLASRVIERKRADYESRTWSIDNETPDASGHCQEQSPVAPAWDDAVVPATFQNPYVDGGVTNNNPFECARQYLVAAAGNDGHNPRDAKDANAAVISVAPFPGYETFNANYDAEAQTHLGNVVSGLLGVLVNQSRFQGEELALTKDPNVYSRFAISPSDDSAGTAPALLCGALSAFGGFVDRKFRDHDYQLGRRNCQKFLMDVFVLPEGNVAIAQGVTKQADAQDTFRGQYALVGSGTYWYPVIPLMESVKAEVPLPNRTDYFTDEARLEAVAQAATNRLKAVLNASLSSPAASHAGLSFLVKAIFDLGGAGKVKSYLLAKLKEELAGQTAAMKPEG